MIRFRHHGRTIRQRRVGNRKLVLVLELRKRFPRMDKGGDRIPKHQICHRVALSHLINSLQANPKQILGLSAGMVAVFLPNLIQIEFWPVSLTAKVFDKKMMKSEVVKYDDTRMTQADMPNR